MNRHAQLKRIVQVLHPPDVIIVTARVGIIDPLFQSAISIAIGVDTVFASTSIHDELFQLRLQFLNQFLLFSMHGKK
jgi:hypothetical protein